MPTYGVNRVVKQRPWKNFRQPPVATSGLVSFLPNLHLLSDANGPRRCLAKKYILIHNFVFELQCHNPAFFPDSEMLRTQKNIDIYLMIFIALHFWLKIKIAILAAAQTTGMAAVQNSGNSSKYWQKG